MEFLFTVFTNCCVVGCFLLNEDFFACFHLTSLLSRNLHSAGTRTRTSSHTHHVTAVDGVERSKAVLIRFLVRTMEDSQSAWIVPVIIVASAVAIAVVIIKKVRTSFLRDLYSHFCSQIRSSRASEIDYDALVTGATESRINWKFEFPERDAYDEVRSRTTLAAHARLPRTPTCTLTLHSHTTSHPCLIVPFFCCRLTPMLAKTAKR